MALALGEAAIEFSAAEMASTSYGIDRIRLPVVFFN